MQNKEVALCSKEMGAHPNPCIPKRNPSSLPSLTPNPYLHLLSNASGFLAKLELQSFYVFLTSFFLPRESALLKDTAQSSEIHTKPHLQGTSQFLLLTWQRKPGHKERSLCASALIREI